MGRLRVGTRTIVAAIGLVLFGVPMCMVAAVWIEKTVAVNAEREVRDAMAIVERNIGGSCGTPYWIAMERVEQVGVAAVPSLLAARRDPGLHPVVRGFVERALVRVIVGGRLHELYWRVRYELQRIP